MVPCAILTASQTLVPKLIGILTLQCARYCRPALARSALAARHTRAGGATQAFPGKCCDNTFYMGAFRSAFLDRVTTVRRVE